MKKLWLICLLTISVQATAVDPDILKYQKAVTAGQLYIQQLENENKLWKQKSDEGALALKNCEASHSDFLGITKTHWAIIGFAAGAGLAIWARGR